MSHCLKIAHNDHENNMHVYSVTVMTRVKTLEVGQFGHGTFEIIRYCHDIELCCCPFSEMTVIKHINRNVLKLSTFWNMSHGSIDRGLLSDTCIYVKQSIYCE